MGTWRIRWVTSMCWWWLFFYLHCTCLSGPRHRIEQLYSRLKFSCLKIAWHKRRFRFFSWCGSAQQRGLKELNRSPPAENFFVFLQFLSCQLWQASSAFRHNFGHVLDSRDFKQMKYVVFGLLVFFFTTTTCGFITALLCTWDWRRWISKPRPTHFLS